IRLLGAADKTVALRSALESPSLEQGKQVFIVDPTSFTAVPRTPFAYWVSDDFLDKFRVFQPFESDGRVAQRALSTNNDFRYLRLSWERFADQALTRPASGWFPFAKGGQFSRFYADIYLIVNWIDEGREIEAEAIKKFPYLKGNASWVMHRECNYIRPGITWPRRTQGGLSVRIMPTGCLFADKGPSAFVEGDSSKELCSLLAIINSSTFRAFVDLQMAFGSFEVGVIQRTPVPELSAADREALAGLARRAWALKRSLDTRNETSHAFELPALLSCIRNASSVRAEVSKHEYSLAMRAAMWGEHVKAVEAELVSIQAEIDERCFDLYDIGEEDRRAIAPEKDRPTPTDGDDASLDSDVYIDEADAEADDGDEADETAAADTASLTAELVSWAFGAAFGRFDVRLATGGREPPPVPEPFDPLPACSAGMLTGPDGLPCAAPPEGYPVAFPSNGILADDPGHPRDIEPLVRSILDTIVFAGQPVEQEICENLGVKSLREYFRKPALFFADHLKQYSKSRRKAPIYWPLSTAS
ncbi:MAG TPA: hypothetical protein PLY73_16285, partial [Candidatus Ozemobacteraceae bacterium]|nr:hypothetical protein [Candidatus Ozemobacteraceae bacterium]